MVPATTTLKGGLGDDMLDGGSGVDTFDGGAGNDMLYVDAQDLTTTTPADIDGGTGDDDTIVFTKIEGEAGVTLILGATNNQGIENVIGSKNDDMLTGASGDDNMLDGGAGNDTLNGMGGKNTLKGGPGRDKFIWNDGDTIKDFNPDEDMLDLTSETVTAGEVNYDAHPLGGVIVSFGADDTTRESVVLEGVSLTDLEGHFDAFLI